MQTRGRLWGQALIICYLKQPSAVSYQRSDTQWLRGSLWNAECGMWNVESSKFRTPRGYPNSECVSVPMAKKFHPILHLLSGPGGDQFQKAACLLTDRIPLLVGKDHTSVGSGRSHVSGVQTPEISNIETVEYATLGHGVVQMLPIYALNLASLQGSEYVYAASPESLNQVPVHRVLIHIEPDPHEPFLERNRSRSRRSASISSAEISASISSRLA